MFTIQTATFGADTNTSTTGEQSSLKIIFDLMSELFSGKAKSSEEQRKSQCASLAEIEKYLNENPEHKAEAETQLSELRKECVGVNSETPEFDIDPSSDLNLDQSLPMPAGRCTEIATQAVKKVTNNKYLIDTYKKASAATNVPWEILAAIHYVEAGNNPNSSLISGRSIGFPEPDQGMNRYGSLLETALRAAEVFKEKRALAMSVTKSGPDDFETLVHTFALYNGGGNSQCIGSTPKALAPGYVGCPAKFKYEDHIYPLACFDKKHENMYVIFCGDGKQCVRPRLYDNIGALTFIKALRDELDPPQIGPLNRQPSPSGPTLQDGLVYYPQCNGAQHTATWSQQPMKDGLGRIIYGTDRFDRIVACTYCKASCGLASSAMIVSSYTNQRVDPTQFLSTYNTAQPMTCDGAYLPTLGTTLKKYGVVVGGHIPFNQIPLTDTLFIQKAKSYLQNGWTLLTLGYFNNIGHYVWIVGVDDQSRFLVYDPYWGVSSPLPFNSKNYTSARITYITPVRK